MDKIVDFLRDLHEQFKGLESSLAGILKEEKSLHDEILVKKGFVIHSYSLNYGAIDFEILSQILRQLENILKKEVQIQNNLEGYFSKLENVEKDYSLVTGKKLHTVLLAKYLKEALYCCNLMITRIKQLEVLLQEGIKIHKKSIPRETEMFFASFESVGNKILRFVRFLEQFTQKIIDFEAAAYYPEPRTYGRIMSSREFKKMAAEERLSSRQDPTPVFDAPAHVYRKIRSMTKDQLKNYFKLIGVRSFDNLVFFRTNLKPINHDRPVPQSNGLMEYKFPIGIKVEILEAA